MMSGKACLSGPILLNSREALPPKAMTRISFDNPCYYFTSVTHNRFPVFRIDKFKELLCSALNEVRTSSGMLFFAYVIMSDHFHIVTDGKRSPSDSLRYLNGITARRIINYLKEGEFHSSLEKLRQERRTRIISIHFGNIIPTNSC